MRIDPEILLKTVHCTKTFECLHGEKSNICEVERCVGDEVHFIKCKGTNSCNYVFSFGLSHICRCPIRKELFQKYGV